MSELDVIVIHIRAEQAAEYERLFAERELPRWREYKERDAFLSARIFRAAFGTDRRDDIAKYVIAVEVPSHAEHSQHDADPGSRSSTGSPTRSSRRIRWCTADRCCTQSDRHSASAVQRVPTRRAERTSRRGFGLGSSEVDDRGGRRPSHVLEGLDPGGDQPGQLVDAGCLGPGDDVAGAGQDRRFRDTRQVPASRESPVIDLAAGRCGGLAAGRGLLAAAGHDRHSGFVLEHLATLTRNQVRFAGATATAPMLAEPTSAQRQAFDLIGIPIPLTLK